MACALLQHGALEGTEYIEESAAQLYLETDPSAREPPERYRVNYQVMARDQLVAALGQLEDLRGRLGAPPPARLPPPTRHCT